MRKLTFVICALISLLCVHCSQADLQQENEELLDLTRTLTEQLEECNRTAEAQSARAVQAEAEADIQRTIALEAAASAKEHSAELEQKLREILADLVLSLRLEKTEFHGCDLFCCLLTK